MGYYYVAAADPLAADRVERFFVATLAYLRTHAEAFDQKLINCLMKSWAGQMDQSYVSLFSRAGCKGQKISLDDPALKPLTDVAAPTGSKSIGDKQKVLPPPPPPPLSPRPASAAEEEPPRPPCSPQEAAPSPAAHLLRAACHAWRLVSALD